MNELALWHRAGATMINHRISIWTVPAAGPQMWLVVGSSQ